MLKNKLDSGIYAFLSRKNGKYYVGSANSIKRRRGEHFRDLKANRHCNSKLQRHYNKYSDDLIFYVLEYCAVEELEELENFWIEELDSYTNGFNLVEKAERGLLGHKHSLESRKKMSEKIRASEYFVSGKIKDVALQNLRHATSIEGRLKSKNAVRQLNRSKNNNAFWGKRHSAETKQNLSEKGKQRGLIGEKNPNFGKEWSPERKQQMSIREKNRSYFIACVFFLQNAQTEEIIQINNFREWCSQNKLSYSNFSYFIKQNGVYKDWVLLDKTPQIKIDINTPIYETI